jgi:DnaJ-class molecular chaperone
MATPYEILGVAANASAEDIQKSSRQPAKKNHPDLHPYDKEAETRFKIVSAANALLSGPEKRAQYDFGEIDECSAERRERSFYKDYLPG